MTEDDERRVVARLRYPMGVEGIDKAMNGLCRMYRDPNLVVVTGGPLFVEGWMTIARPTPEEE